MGRHTAADSAARDPLVADALDRRPAAAAHGVHEALPGREGPIGWPAGEPDGDGEVGWPGELPVRTERTDDGEAGSPEPAPAAPQDDAPRGWRRLLGRPHAA